MSPQDASTPARLRRRAVGLARRVARRARREAKARRLLRPAVSIVLPVFNVEAYLRECLDSIAAQTFDDYELIVVDDGSPDGSRAIAEEYAAADPRIRVVGRENGGLGAARNTGVLHARGEYLTFVDSDDTLPPRALEVLVGSARLSGSDVVVGAPQRFDRLRTWRPQWVAGVHTELRRGVRTVDFLPVLRNLYTWDKLFRREFYLAQGLSFREGVAYEDQPIVTQLLARAGTIDVLPDVVYHYRARDDQSSISQQTATVKDLRDRIEAWRVSRETLRAEVDPVLYDGWLQTLFEAHFHWYVASPGTADDEYWSLLRAAVVELTDEAPPEVWAATSPDKRVALELVRQDRRADVQEFVRVGAAKLEQWRSEVRPDGVLLQLPFFGDPALDESLFLLRPQQLTVAHAIENIHWVEQGQGRATVEISGWAFVPKVDLGTHAAEVSVVLRGPAGERRTSSVEPVEPSFPPPSDDLWCDYAPGRFRVAVPLHEVLAAADDDDRWQVLLEVRVAGFTAVSPVVRLLRSGSAGVIPAADLGDGRRVVADWRQYFPLQFRVERRQVEVVDLALSGRELSGRLVGRQSRDLERVGVSAGRTVTSARVSGDSFVVSVPPTSTPMASRGPRTADVWDVSGHTLDADSVPLSLSGPMGLVAVETLAGGVLAAERNRNGDLFLSEAVALAVADTLEVDDDGELVVRGRVWAPRVTDVTLVGQHLKTTYEGAATAPAEGGFVASLPLRHHVYRFGDRPLPCGDHDVMVRVRTDEGEFTVPLRLSAELSGALPIPVRSRHYEGRLVRGPSNGVRLVLVRPIGDARGKYQQNRLRMTAPSGRLHRGVLMRSYFGESATDNGLAVQAELARRGSDLPVYWAVQDHSVPIPDGGIPVVVNSREFYELLGSVSYYIDNMYQPEFHAKPDGQVIVQTFHGYPFKKMGHPHWQNLQFSQARIRSYDERAAQWDYLVSPARYATPLLVRDFAYPGEVLEIGYPRNDVLQSPQAPGIREETRRELGIREGQVAVLYAPTFRDYLSADDSSAAMASFFDFAAAHRHLGDDFVILIRGHAFNARANERVGRLPGTIDVTDYPEVSDLYLAADAAIVDYSSLRFDFGVTGKPMVFHVPDLQRYKDTRGWLFDFEPTAPGPLVDTTEQVVAALLDLDGVRARYADAYARFRSDFLDLEDGQAAARLVDRVFVPRGDA